MVKVAKLTDLNRKLEQDLRDLERVALSLESKANETVFEKDREIVELRKSIDEVNRRLLDFERGTYKFENSEYFNLKKALHDCSEEKRHLNKKLSDAKFNERMAKDDAEKLRLKLSKLKSKVIEPFDESTLEMDRIRQEKEYYFNEYTKLLESSRESLEKAQKRHTIEIAAKNIEIASLKSQFNEMKRISSDGRGDHASLPMTALHCHSYQANLHRLERERDVAVALKEQALLERDKVLDRLNSAVDAVSKEQNHHIHSIDELKQQVRDQISSKNGLIGLKFTDSTT